jgi:hypothetical protein
MTTYKRFGNRWTVNECLQLQREFELLQLPIDEIAQIHQRTPNAIMFKLDAEDIADYNVLYSSYHDLNNVMPVTRKSSYPDSDQEDVELNMNDDYYMDDDNSSDYEDSSVGSELDDDEDSCSDDNSGNPDNLRQHMLRLEKQVQQLTQMMMGQSQGKKAFSFFG